MCSGLGNQSQVYELTLKLREIRQGEDTGTKYFNSLKRLWQDLDLFNDYEWKSSEDCKHFKKTVEDNHIFKFLIGLNMEFDEVRGRIIGRQPLPSIGEVFSEVRREKSRRLVMLAKGISVTLLKTRPLLVVLMLAELLQRNLMKSLVFGVITAISHGIHERLAGRSTENQQIGRVLLLADSLVLLLHMRPSLSPLTKSRWITF